MSSARDQGIQSFAHQTACLRDTMAPRRSVTRCVAGSSLNWFFPALYNGCISGAYNSKWSSCQPRKPTIFSIITLDESTMFRYPGFSASGTRRGVVLHVSMCYAERSKPLISQWSQVCKVHAIYTHNLKPEVIIWPYIKKYKVCNDPLGVVKLNFAYVVLFLCQNLTNLTQQYRNGTS